MLAVLPSFLLDRERMPDHVVAASLVETYTDADGQQSLRLTPDGLRVARQLAMLGEDGQDELMAGLLDGAKG